MAKADYAGTITETLTPEEYDTLVALKAKADRLIGDRADAYLVVVGGHTGGLEGIRSVKYTDRSRVSRDPDGRYDVIVSVRDKYGDYNDTTEVYVPSSLLWEPEATIERAVERLAAERAAAEEAEKAQIAALVPEREKAEKAQLRRLARKLGYALTKAAE